MEHKLLKKILVSTCILLICPSFFYLYSCSHSIHDIKPQSANGLGSDGHGANYAIDNDPSTYYETPPPNGEYSGSYDDSFRTNIDFTFDGIYAIKNININQFVNNDKYLNTYNHYEIYVSIDHDDWKKIAYKTNNDLATIRGDTINLKRTCLAHTVRVNLSFNSSWDYQTQDGWSGMTCPLSETSFKGYFKNSFHPSPSQVITNWNQTQYYDSFEEFQDNPIPIIASAMKKLVGRILGAEYENRFLFELPWGYKKSSVEDHFILQHSASDEAIIVYGDNANALAMGFNFYIKNYLQVDYNPLFSSHLINKTLFPPNNLPIIENITKTVNYQYRYALNYCTYSYTMAFWNWNEWQKFLDWAVMNGINLMLDITGQEEVIRETLIDFGYNDKKAKQYICGPGYFAWFMMGNMTGYGGELSDSWFYQRVELARKIHELEQIYDITPIFQGFAGNIPDDLFGSSSKYLANGWCNFTHVQNFLDPINSSSTFQEFLAKFNQHTIDLFGDITNFRSADPFHERSYQNSPNTTVRSQCYVKILQDWRNTIGANVVWLMQQWGNSVWESDLSAIKNNGWNNNVLVLDLYADVSPNHTAMENTQTPWIWTMINNFGGRMGIYGQPQNLLNVPSQGTTNNVYMSGIGIAPESFGNSPILYEALLDMNLANLESRQTLTDYVDQYLNRSYGNQYNDYKNLLSPRQDGSGAWKYLLNTAYNPNMSGRGDYQGAPESVFNARPKHDVQVASAWGGTTLGYDASVFKNALNPFIQSYIGNQDSQNASNFIYDMVDVTRQCLQNWALGELSNLWSSYTNENYLIYKAQSNQFLNAIDLQNKILSKIQTQTLSYWIDQSRSVLTNMNDWDKDLCEFNARSLITTWGYVRPCNGQTNNYLHDYSNRQWSGLTSSLYKDRWQKYFNWMNDTNNHSNENNDFQTNDWFKLEWEWVNRKADEGFGFDDEKTNESLKSLAEQVQTLINA